MLMSSITEPVLDRATRGISPDRARSSLAQSHTSLDHRFEEKDAPVEFRLSYASQIARVAFSLVIIDLVVIASSLTLAFFAVQWFGGSIDRLTPILVFGAPALLIGMWLAGCYPAIGLSPAQELQRIVRGCFASSLVFGLAATIVGWTSLPYFPIAIMAFPIVVFCLPLARGLARDWMRKRGVSVPFYFVGCRQEVLQVHHEMSRFSWSFLSPAGRFSFSHRNLEKIHIGDSSDHDLQFEDEVPYLGEVTSVETVGKRSGVNWIIFVGDCNSQKNRQTAETLQQAFPQVICISPQSPAVSTTSSVLSCGLAVGLRYEKNLLLMGPRIQKRLLDIILSFFLLSLSLPLLLMIGLVIRFTSRGPVLLRNPRIGQDGKVFFAWKFRSMVVNADEVLELHLAENPSFRLEWEENHKLKEDPRVTQFGRFLRKTSLDELPQLWNVLVGQMSLVGPRPILEEEVVKYGNTYRDYLKVKPGITGLWQVSGRNNTEYSERLVMVRYYVRSWSPWLDWYILIRTIRTVLLCEGSY